MTFGDCNIIIVIYIYIYTHLINTKCKHFDKCFTDGLTDEFCLGITSRKIRHWLLGYQC